MGGVRAEVDICEDVPPFKIFVRFYFRYILWYTKMATGFAPIVQGCSILFQFLGCAEMFYGGMN